MLRNAPVVIGDDRSGGSGSVREYYSSRIVPEGVSDSHEGLVTPELFVMPTPLMVNVKPGLAVMVKGLRRAFESNTIPLTSVLAEIERSVVLDKSKKAVSDAPLGTVAGLQFVLVFQSPERGLRFHVALPAWLVWMQSIKINALKIAVTSGSGVFMGSRRMVRDVQPCPAFISLIS